MDIQALSAKFGINAEYVKEGTFPVFVQNIAGKKVLLVADQTTQQFLPRIEPIVRASAAQCGTFILPEREPVADKPTVAAVSAAGEGYDYLLAVGAGTLNDLCKYAGFLLIEDGFKITRPAQTASDVLIDPALLCRAPRIMIGAGVGDILAKYCCLTDWRISSCLTGEAYGEEAASLMYDAVRACDESIPALQRGEAAGVEKLMEALLVSGYAMVIAGNSRPASGAEHHMSHFLEMDFLRRGKRIPLHGVKVGLGTIVSLYLYETLKSRPAFEGCERVYAEAEKLPGHTYAEEVLSSLGCPTRFSQLDVEADTVRRMFLEAYKIRDRFTILTLYCTKGWMDTVADELMERFY